MQVTVIAKSGGPLTKRILLAPDGSLSSDGSACVMSRGTAKRFIFADVERFATLIEHFRPDQAIALGGLRPDLPDEVLVTTKRKLNGGQESRVIARTSDYFVFQPGEPALALIDYDTKGMPLGVAERIEKLGGLLPALISVLPGLASAARVERRSTSAGLYRTDTGEKLTGSSGLHVFVSVQDGSDVERFLKVLHARCWLAGFGWLMVGVAGQLLERSIVDRVVGTPERLVFEGPPILCPPLDQDKTARRPFATEGEILDSICACPPLSILDKAKLRELRAKETARLKPDSVRARKVYVAERAEQLARRTGMSGATAAQIIERQCSGVLLPDIELPFDDEDLEGCTVAAMLADPDRFVDATLADPLEGIEYGRGKAKVMRWADGTIWIHSFAHGRTNYELKYTSSAAKAELKAAPKEKIADLFVRLALAGDLSEHEVEELRNVAHEQSGVNKRTLNSALKNAKRAALAQRRDTEREEGLVQRRDPRPQIPTPLRDAPWLPQMDLLDEVLGGSQEPEPPMRDIDGVITRVRVRQTPNMHTFTALGANQEEIEEMRLLPPEQPLLTRLTLDQLAELIERYIDYVDEETGRSVHLGNAFVRHFHTRNDDALPVVVAIATLPIVLGDGTLLAGRGLDRDRGIVFRVPPKLSHILPNKEDCTELGVANAMRFLTDEWLCDVACDYAGKCTLVAAALTVIQRSLLPDRPAFWVTAGRRGGGKTTAIIMILFAVTGIRPAAAAWSPNEEERRKALLAYLLEALPAIVWDNIPRGSQISCPHIEKSCTTETYSDRKLGVSETVATSAATIHIFTGNNIGPRGDLASRSLQIRLEVDRPDPENRGFEHSDPIGWTDARRGQILAALYTVLLGNPRRDPKNKDLEPRLTRFKEWWDLVGSAVEHAAKLAKKESRGKKINSHVDDVSGPPPVSFKDLFLTQEEDEEESASLTDALALLSEKWPRSETGLDATFTAADVAKLANTTGEWAPEMDRMYAETLRDFLFPRITSATQAVTAKATGRRLNRHVGAPVRHNGKILTLKKSPDTHANALRYYVETRSISG
jgi:hypothetical protein